MSRVDRIASPRSHKLAPRRAAALALLLAVPLVHCGGDEPPRAPVVRPVKTEVFGNAEAGLRFSYPGRVHPDEEVELGFEVAGQIVELPVKKGEAVSAGDLIARLDQRDYENALASAEAQATEARAQADRQRGMLRERATSKAAVDRAVAREQSTAAEVRIRRKALQDTELRASFDGVVANRYAENFENVLAKQPIVALHALDRLEVRINIPEQDFASAPDPSNLGRLSAVFDVLPGREFALELEEFENVADPATQTFQAILVFDNPGDLGLAPGMTTTVHWEPPSPSAGPTRTLPVSAVLGQSGRAPWVWVIDDDWTASKRTVQVGAIVESDRIEIRTGLEAGDRVAVGGAHRLAESMKVREYRP